MVITIDATKDVNKVYESTWEKLNTGKILKHWLKNSILLINKSKKNIMMMASKFIFLIFYKYILFFYKIKN